MELKHPQPPYCTVFLLCINRTSVELKLISGILVLNWPLRINRTSVELKQISPYQQEYSMYRINRTSVELKPKT